MAERPDLRRKIDSRLLYEHLWRLADRNGNVKVNQSHLADSLAIDRVTLWRQLQHMLKDGRLTKVKEGHARVVTYRVLDPELYKWIEK